MKPLSAKGQRWLKCFHVFFCSVWTGAGVALLAINLFMKANDGMELYGINASMKFIDDFIIIPGAVGCFLTGVLYSSCTAWGWFKQPWITTKWVITLFGILSGTFLLGPKLNSLPLMVKAQGINALSDPTYVGTKHLLYGFGGFQVATIVFAVYISILKPWRRKGVE